MKHECIKPVRLPDVEIYGGDCTPWEISLVRENGTKFIIQQGIECTATFTMIQVNATNLSSITSSQDIVLSKSGTFSETSDGGVAVQFPFAEEDTKELWGKFLYQIEIRHGEDVRIGQGDLYIRANINQ